MSGELHLGVPASKYHADGLCPQPSLSNSIAQIMLARSPLHAWSSHPRLGNLPGEKGDDDKFDYGSACHDVLLEGGSKLVILNPEDYRSKPTKADPEGRPAKGWTNDAIRTAREAARTEGKIPVLPGQAYRITGMVEAAREFLSRSELSETWAGGDSEVTCTWQESGIWLRARFDRLSRNRTAIIDYKSTTDANPEHFARHLVRMDYHIQDAFYLRGLKAANPKLSVKHFYFLAQEGNPPYACSLHTCDDNLRAIADKQIDWCIAVWADCLKTGVWSGYDSTVNIAAPPNWMLERAVEDGTIGIAWKEQA